MNIATWRIGVLTHYYLASAFQSITPSVCYVLGVSDNGGSTVRTIQYMLLFEIYTYAELSM